MKFNPKLENWRLRSGQFASKTGESFGAFYISFRNLELKVIASNGDLPDYPWEHVSVSLNNRCPNWEEMCFIKDLFWDEEETVMQLHPPKSQWINNHPYCLHMWKPLNYEIPLPPSITVGVK